MAPTQSDLDLSPSSWTVKAAELPVRFAQVREDALQDLALVQELGNAARVVMIASGGCTAAALAASGRVAQLHLVDANPTQIALSRVKLHILQKANAAERLALLGHLAMPTAERGARLSEVLAVLGLPADALGPVDAVAELGPDHAGRNEQVFAQLRIALGNVAEELATVLELREPLDQGRRIEPETCLGRGLDAACAQVMTVPNLVKLFETGPTKNRIEPLAQDFARRTRHVLATLPAADNPYLWQIFRGCFPPDVLSPWLAMPAPPRMPRVTTAATLMANALRAARPGESDLVHLSNILDWLDPEDVRTTLALAWRALRPGGWVIIRQRNSTLDIPSLGKTFLWDRSWADALHAVDRSFFYRALHLGRKP